MSQKKIFDEFTNQYALSKTLRFELRPIGNTQKMLEDIGVIKADEERKKRYEATKPYFDRLHQEFINESLQGATLSSLAGYAVIYSDWKKDKKNTEVVKKLEKKEKEIREEIVSLFAKKAAEWVQVFSDDAKLKKANHEFLFEPAVFSVLKKKYGNEPGAILTIKNKETEEKQEVPIFDSWDKWTAYFGKFFETRKNFYKSDGIATAVATRIVNGNLRRFCDNIDFYKSVKNKLDLSELSTAHEVNLDQVFTLDSYNNYLNQAGIDYINTIIGATKDKQVEGINQYVNKYKQKTGEKLSRLKKLDKQIGSDKENFIDVIESDKQLKEQLATFVEDAKIKIDFLNKGFTYLVGGQVNLSCIYFRKEAINTVARRWFASYEKIADALVSVSKDKSIKFDKASEEYKFPDFISWQVIRDAVEKLSEDGDVIWKSYYIEGDNKLPLEGKSPWQQFLNVFNHEYQSLVSNGHTKDGRDFVVLASELEALLAKETLNINETSTQTIKSFLDRTLNIYRFAKYFTLDKKGQWNVEGLETDDFYVDYEEIFYSDAYEKIIKPYDRVRNYLTKKPFNQDKWKLNFENPTLADGWDKNKETDNTSVILRKGGRYYLAVMSKGNNTLFKKVPVSDSGYQKMNYKLFPDPAKMMPKVCFSKKGLEFFKPSEDILDIYKNSRFKKGDTFSVPAMQTLIDFYKTALGTYEGWKMYDFSNIKETKSYTENIGKFYRDVAESGYKISFENISEQYIEDANNNGKLYLFEIHNKDWNLKDGVKKTGSKNTHTLYFEQVFSDENAQNNFVVKLNGEAELFFRPKTKGLRKEQIITKQNKITLNKGEKAFAKNRYTEDKMFFHVPITLNRTAPNTYKFNQSVNGLLANNPDINIIGIDRGEKHLAYLSVINQKGEILEIKSLNEINGVKYADLLDVRAKEREQNRRDWKSVEQIKDLKKGYISYVVREIADLIIKHNAIVVFEDLNMRFKQVRGGIEKSVYQQLEKALIDKLNFLVDKNELDSNKAGHILKAYQLTEQFESFQKMGKQTGVLFYTQAEYTSQTDPVTGFRKNLYISNSATIEKIKEFARKLDRIGWDDEKRSYFFEYNPINFVDKKLKDSTLSKTWRVYANVPRIKREKKGGYWETVGVNPNEKFLELFDLWGFDNLHTEDMKDLIFQMESDERFGKKGAKSETKLFDGKQRNFWHSFIYLFNLVMQVRNSTATQYKKDENGNVIETIEGVDFLSSPVEPFFCTDGGEYTEGYVNMAGMEKKFIGDSDKKEKFVKEFNGDANGAYNIARKGVMILGRIEEYDRLTEEEKKKQKYPNLFIARKDWDEFVQNNK